MQGTPQIVLLAIIRLPFLLSSAFNANAVTVRLSNQNSGKEITVKTGDVIHIELESPGATGYSWNLGDTDYRNPLNFSREIAKSYLWGVLGAPVIPRRGRDRGGRRLARLSAIERR